MLQLCLLILWRKDQTGQIELNFNWRSCTMFLFLNKRNIGFILLIFISLMKIPLRWRIFFVRHLHFIGQTPFSWCFAPESNLSSNWSHFREFVRTLNLWSLHFAGFLIGFYWKIVLHSSHIINILIFPIGNNQLWIKRIIQKKIKKCITFHLSKVSRLQIQALTS